MGTDIKPIGNHKIKFRGRTFEDLTQEIKIKLDNTIFTNADFLRLEALNDWRNRPRQIREIKTKKDWTFDEEDEFYSFKEYKDIGFNGPFDLKLYFDKQKITFNNPSCRYSLWFEWYDDVRKDEWRRYMYQIVKLFGGDRVIYLADNGHPLNKYLDYKGNFENIEKGLKEEFGEPAKTFEEMNVYDKHYPDVNYFIDDFSTINWDSHVSLDEYLPEPDDKSSIDYDLTLYSSKNKLKTVCFDNKTLLHKVIDGKIHFYHLAVKDGLFCIHKGQVGGEETLDVVLDEYAPFTYDALVKELEESGFQTGEEYSIMYNGSNWSDALAELTTELIWAGIGRFNCRSSGSGEDKYWLYAVDDKLLLNMVLDFGKKYNADGTLKIIRHDTRRKKTVIYQQ
jgi:hypothetical protein